MKKYRLFNAKKRKYFKEYKGRNKPIWVISTLDAAEYDKETAERYRRRLACQSQIVILMEAQRNNLTVRAWNEETS